MSSTHIETEAEDGSVLRGIWWPGSPACALLVHDLGEDLDAWQPLQAALAEIGCSRLALDLRGHGLSDGAPAPEGVASDVEAAMRVAERYGADHFCVITAGRAGIALLAMERVPPLAAIALLSPGPLGQTEVSSLRGPGTRKLFIVGSHDPESASAVEQLHRASIGWSYTVSLPTSSQGSALLHGSHAVHVTEHICSLVHEFANELPAHRAELDNGSPRGQ